MILERVLHGHDFEYQAIRVYLREQSEGFTAVQLSPYNSISMGCIWFELFKGEAVLYLSALLTVLD